MEVQKVAEALRVFIPEGSLTELRALSHEGPDFYGFFNRIDLMAKCAIELSATSKGVYFVPNPVRPELLERSPNTISETRKGESASDSDIVRRKWLLIDIDPVRPKGENASKTEQEEAWRVLLNVRSALAAAGFDDSPVVACSGNGWHLNYPIDLPNDDATREQIRQLLAGLAARCNSTGAKVDKSTFNASRIWKIYGTTARKGPSTDDRPQRVAWVSESRGTWEQAAIRSNSEGIARALEIWESHQRAHERLTQRQFQSPALNRCREYLARMAPAISGQGGHNRAYHAAMIVVEGFGLSGDEALAALDEWNGRCQPPWTPGELRHKLESAAKACTPGNVGHLLSQVKNGGPMGPGGASGRTSNGSQPWRGVESLPPPTPTPEDDPVATVADLIKREASIHWVWPSWIQQGVLTAIAADPGCGKTRFCADLARRILNGLPWPDGAPHSAPADPKIMWIASDGHWAELATLSQEFGYDPERIILNGTRSNPYAGTSLDSQQDIADLADRIKKNNPYLVFVDTVGGATSRNTTRPEEAKEFFKPLADLANSLNTAIVLVTHLSKEKKSLGRRIEMWARQIIMLDFPDREQENRRKIWVDKTNSRFPKPMGVTMSDNGNEYDDAPPAAPGEAPSGQGTRARGRPSSVSGEVVDWLRAFMLTGPKRVSFVISEAERFRVSVGTLYRARDAVGAEEYIGEDGRKWWRMPDPFDNGTGEQGEV